LARKKKAPLEVTLSGDEGHKGNTTQLCTQDPELYITTAAAAIEVAAAAIKVTATAIEVAAAAAIKVAAAAIEVAATVIRFR